MKSTHLKKITLSLLLASTLPNVYANDEWDINLTGYLGHKKLEQNDWPNTDSHASVGLLFDFKKENWPINLAIDLIATDEAFDINIGSFRETSATTEVHLGVRKFFDFSTTSFRPYIGGGIANIDGEIKIKNNEGNFQDDNSELGYWVGVGTYYAFSSHVLLGVDIRYSNANGEILNIDRDMGGLHSGISIGYSW